jgi:hypothetical protein
MVVRVEYRLMPGMGYTSIVHCGEERIKVSLLEAGDWLWDYPILAGVKYRDRFMVDVAIPPEVAERLNIVNCIKDVITIPPREYLFAVADEGDLVQVRNEEGGMGKKTVDLVHYGIV